MPLGTQLGHPGIRYAQIELQKLGIVRYTAFSAVKFITIGSCEWFNYLGLLHFGGCEATRSATRKRAMDVFHMGEEAAAEAELSLINESVSCYMYV